jgi:hypothetical protein
VYGDEWMYGDFSVKGIKVSSIVGIVCVEVFSGEHNR